MFRVTPLVVTKIPLVPEDSTRVDGTYRTFYDLREVGGSSDRGGGATSHFSGSCFAVLVGVSSSLRAFHPEPLTMERAGLYDGP
jgi:hypothetical protein